MLKDFSKLKITLASPQQILSWSNGEVKKAETINYRTQRSEVDGLMCEKIFGPTKSYQCYCGKYKKIRYKGIICDKCGVEVTHNRVRKERMGHITLSAPIVHTWFSHGIPNKLSLILDVPKKKLEAVIYFARYIVTEVDEGKKVVVRQDVQDKMDKDIEDLELELNKEVESKEKEYRTELDKLTKDGKKGLEVESVKARQDKEIAKLHELYMRKKVKVREKHEQLLDLIDKVVVGEAISEEQNTDLLELKSKFYKVQMGAEGIRTLLGLVDLDAEVKKLLEEKAATRSKVKQRKLMSRLRVVQGLQKNKLDPRWMVMEVIPVIPPALRPIIQLPGGRFATSDLNDLYRRVINRNNRLKRLIDLGAPEIILRNEKRMLQEAVDALIDNSHRQGRPVLNSRGQPYKSLSDTLRGKQGRFRQNLLGKRVDYSGRAVIVAGPELELYECGLPKDIALELFKPFVIREVIAKGLSPNIKSAKNYVEEQSAEVWDILEDVIKDRPVLLNRAPTLHKQGIQAFFPVLSEGNAIRVHPMVCKGFNADFDGDQMAVHVPLSKKAVEEALERMMPDSNMLLMANGNPVINTNKDMALGIYLLSKMEETDSENIKSFASKDELMSVYDLDEVGLNEKIKVMIDGKLIETCLGRVIMNEGLPKKLGFINEQVNQARISQIVALCFKKFGKKETIKVLDFFEDIGFKYATLLGFSVAIDDFVTTDQRDVLLKKAEDQIERLNESYDNGLITEEERKSLSEEVWMKTTEEISDLTMKEYEKKGNVVILENSGAYPVKNPTRQISAIRGLILDPMGNIVELPLRSNYLLGLTPLEYFVAARGTRKGLTDIALKTALSGYLTRKMIDVAQDVITRIDDCGTDQGIPVRESENRRISYEERIVGRWTSEDIVDKETGGVIVEKNDEITEELAREIVDKGINELYVRSPLTCTAEEGICRKCYGYNLGTKKLVDKGMAVGVIAAQAMGEAATQLTLDSKHLAGRAGTDITQGLPRVEELFEARIPKGKSVLSDMDGKIKLIRDDDENVEKIVIKYRDKIEKKYTLKSGDKVLRKKGGKVKAGKEIIERKSGRMEKAPFDGDLVISDGEVILGGVKIQEKEYDVSEEDVLVKDGEEVRKGDQLTVGSADPKHLMKLKGLKDTEKYIIDNIQETYGVQGISIDDKHVEVIVRKMAHLVFIEEPGDSEHLPGEYANYFKIMKENEDLKKAGKVTIEFSRKLLGITAASINTGSFLSAASFQEVVRVLSDAALVGKSDHLRGLKENVIIGRYVPIGEYLR
ncbi:MAG: DNA-directed RNA polymerase subunit beta' [Candidatus Dojkabacteria bacterium]|nr:DNA-directed RNA polymerase subunit beta' [Candidatus Dojkabacteria bacterium]